jgi:hypothetical protein
MTTAGIRRLVDQLPVEAITEILESLTIAQIEQILACRRARAKVAGETLAEEIDRLALQADPETQDAFDGSLEDRARRHIARWHRVGVNDGVLAGVMFHALCNRYGEGRAQEVIAAAGIAWTPRPTRAEAA